MTQIETFTKELAVQKRRYEQTVERGIDLLNGYPHSGVVSTHLGHNLANVATELSMLAGKIESTEAALAYLKAPEAGA